MLKTTKEWTEKLKSAIVKSGKLESRKVVSMWASGGGDDSAISFPFHTELSVKSSQVKRRWKKGDHVTLKKKSLHWFFELPCSLTSIRVCSRRRIHTVYCTGFHGDCCCWCCCCYCCCCWTEGGALSFRHRYIDYQRRRNKISKYFILWNLQMFLLY